MNNRDASIKYICLDGEWMIADNRVASYIDKLEDALLTERREHAQTKAIVGKDIKKTAEHIALNLNSGQDEATRVLKKSLVSSPAFQDTVIQLITYGLTGKNARGNTYK